MREDYPIGAHSRRFYLSAVAVIVAALLLTSIGIGSLGALGVTGSGGSLPDGGSGGVGWGGPSAQETPTTTQSSQTISRNKHDSTTVGSSNTPITTPVQTDGSDLTTTTSIETTTSNRAPNTTNEGTTPTINLTEGNLTATISPNGTLSIPAENLTLNPSAVPEHLLAKIGSEDDPGAKPDTVATPPPPYNVTVEPSPPVPGTQVIVFVTKNETPVRGIPVTFNNDTVGMTGPQGSVIGTVPYSATLTVSAKPPTNATTESLVETLPAGSPPFQSDRVYALMLGTNRAEQGDVSVTLPENISVETDGPLFPGQTATVTVTIEDTPLRGVTLWAAETEIGTTNANGVAEITVPASLNQGDTVMIEARRGTYTGHDTVQLSTLRLNTSTSLPLSLPFTSANATVTTDSGEPVNASLTVYPGIPDTGQPHASIDGSTSLDFSLPLAQQVTVVAEVGAVRLTSSISGMLLHGGIVAAILLLVIGGAAWWARRRIDSERIQALAALALDMMVRFGQYLSDVIDHVVARLQRLYTALKTRPIEFLSEHLRPTSLIQHLHALFDALRQRLADLFGSSSESAISDSATADSTATTHDDDSKSPTGSYRRLRAVWQWFVSLAITERPWSHLTITEVTQRGIDRGLPAQPVTRLRRALLDVEYGNRDPGQRLDETTAAASHIADQTDTEPPQSEHSATQEDTQ